MRDCREATLLSSYSFTFASLRSSTSCPACRSPASSRSTWSQVSYASRLSPSPSSVSSSTGRRP